MAGLPRGPHEGAVFGVLLWALSQCATHTRRPSRSIAQLPSIALRLLLSRRLQRIWMIHILEFQSTKKFFWVSNRPDIIDYFSPLTRQEVETQHVQDNIQLSVSALDWLFGATSMLGWSAGLRRDVWYKA